MFRREVLLHSLALCLCLFPGASRAQDPLPAPEERPAPPGGSQGDGEPAPPEPPARPEGGEESAPLAKPVPPDLSGRGLLALPDLSPLAVLHLQLPINTLEVLSEGDGKFEFNLSWANTYLLEKTFVVDAETYRLTLGGWYAIRDDFYIGAAIPIQARDSGVLDPLIDDVHDVFRFGQGNREKRGRNEYDVSITKPSGRVQELERGVGLGDLVLKANWNVHPGGIWLPAVSLQGLMGLPTSTQGFGSSGLDLGLAVSFHKTVLSRVHLHAVLGGTYFTDSRTGGIQYEKEGYEVILGAEVDLTRRIAFILQSMSFTPLLESPALLNKKRNYVAGGFKWEFVEGFTLELSLVENLYPWTSSADIGFAMGIGFRFD